MRKPTLGDVAGRIAAALAVMLAGAGAGTGPAQAEAVPAIVVPVQLYPRPAAPDCGAMAARYGPQRLWFGAISATRYDQLLDRYRPFSAQGCFLSERECQRWLHESLSYAQGSLNWMRCEPGVPRQAY